ncbi:MAG TPA: disulfide bond formation protein B [Xanthobacteraceae bacterium]|nr:disulfide bond formation protein B [Xanthobacteraceae bacterium]
MIAALSKLARSEPHLSAAVFIAVVGAAALLGAWFFQYVIGLPPCPLCLQQRVPYYFAIPLAVMVALGVPYGAKPRVLQFALLAIAAGMLWNAYLGVYHAGIEWKWWTGTEACAGGLPNFRAQPDILDRIGRTAIVRCDEAPWRFLGLSLAGYNVLISLVLAVAAAWGALARRTAPYGSSSVSQ